MLLILIAVELAIVAKVNLCCVLIGNVQIFEKEPFKMCQILADAVSVIVLISNNDLY